MARKKRKTASATRKRATTPRKTKKWSARVTRESDALDLERDVFKQRSAKK
jgi:hypothetical protein